MDEEEKEVLPEVLASMKLPSRFFLNKNIPLSAIDALERPPALDH